MIVIAYVVFLLADFGLQDAILTCAPLV
jgi:hypothetical protein